MKFFKKDAQSSIVFSDRFIKYSFYNHALKTEETKQIRFEQISNDYSSKLEPASLSLQFVHAFMFIINMIFFISDRKHPFFILVFFVMVGFSVVPAVMKRVRVKTIQTENGEIKIIENNDNVYKNIISKRNEYLKDTYGKVDWNNSHEKEIEKFKWLFDIGAINVNEFREREKEIFSK